MIKQFSLSVAAILFLVANSAPSNLQKSVQVSQQIPKAATVKLTLVNAPGINDEGSRWEIAYELRIANQTTAWEAGKHRKLSDGSQGRVGELIKGDSAKQLLRSARSRQFVFNIPFSPEILERLKQQPRSLVKPTSSNITPEEIQQLKEQEAKSQIFFFYSVINIYDAKLKKNIIIPQLFSWAFSDYPNAQFEIRVEVKSDGGYSINTSLPTRQPSD